MRSTIFDEIGGEPAVTAVVDAFYERLVADPDLMSYFDGRDMRRSRPTSGPWSPSPWAGRRRSTPAA